MNTVVTIASSMGDKYLSQILRLLTFGSKTALSSSGKRDRAQWVLSCTAADLCGCALEAHTTLADKDETKKITSYSQQKVRSGERRETEGD